MTTVINILNVIFWLSSLILGAYFIKHRQELKKNPFRYAFAFSFSGFFVGFAAGIYGSDTFNGENIAWLWKFVLIGIVLFIPILFGLIFSIRTTIDGLVFSITCAYIAASLVWYINTEQWLFLFINIALIIISVLTRYLYKKWKKSIKRKVEWKMACLKK